MRYTLSGVTKAYSGKTVLDIPLLEIEKWGIYALIGPNGSGKTTLLNLLAFLELPTTGEIIYNRKSVRLSRPYLQSLRKTVVMVDQFPILFTTTVQKNMAFGLKLRDVPKKKRDHIITEALDIVGMRSFLKAPAHCLSGGETQRVAIARALSLSPEVFLCDEPTSSVDMENQGVIIDTLKLINMEKKITVIMTTHDRVQAASLCRRTLALDRGKISATAQENRFFGMIKKEAGTSGFLCSIRDVVNLSIPPDKVADKSGKVQVFIDPEKVEMVSPDRDGPPHNRLNARILRVSEEENRIRIIVDGGIWITVFMSIQDYRKKRPLVGDSIDIRIRPDGIRIY